MPSTRKEAMESVEIKPFSVQIKKRGVSGNITEFNFVIINQGKVDDGDTMFLDSRQYQHLYQNRKNWVIVAYWNNRTNISFDMLKSNSDKSFKNIVVISKIPENEDNQNKVIVSLYSRFKIIDKPNCSSRQCYNTKYR